MFKKSISHVKHAIFPIFFEKIEWDMTQIWVSGTWFFISEDWYFLTADHVVKDAPQGSTILYAWNIPYSPITQPIWITEIYSDSKHDIYLWKIDIKVDNYLNLTEIKSELWESICIGWYPLSQLWQNPDGSLNVNNVRQYWTPTFLLDNATLMNMNWKDYPESFLMKDMSMPWMSGWPIFNVEWEVIWVDVMNATRTIPLPEKQIHVDNWVGIHSSFILERIKKYL